MNNHIISIEPLESRIAPATFIVTSLGDSGAAGELRTVLAAADAANAIHPGINTIIFKLPAAAPHSENVIELNSGVLTSKGDVKIIGPGAGKLIIDAGGGSGVFSFKDGVAGTDSPVSISGLTIENGSAANGGGIYSSESLALKSVTVSGNAGTVGTAGIQVVGDSPVTAVSISNSLITGNSGHNGGGVGLYLMKSFTVSNSVFSGNTDSAGGGGGFYAAVTSTGTGGIITGSRITGNTAAFGGGLVLEDSNPAAASVIAIKNSVVSGNQSSGPGGGFYSSSGHILITGSHILGNTASTNGGGVYARSFASLTVLKSTISGNATTNTNTSGQGGAGIFAKGTGSATKLPAQIVSSQVLDNRTTSDGGGVFATGGVALNITSSAFVGNGASAGYGGGVGVEGNTTNSVDLTISSSKFTDNFAKSGAAVATLGSNVTTGDGAFSMTSSLVTGNSATFGGGVFTDVGGAVTFGKDTVTNNSASHYGGGLDINFSQSVLISGGLISGNLASHNGGGLFLYGSKGAINNVTVTGNYSAQGGGVDLRDNSVFTAKADKIFANSAPNGPDVDGGGLTFV